MDVKRLVNLIYVVTGVLIFVIYDKFLLWIWPYLENGVNSLLRSAGAESNLLHNWSILGAYITLTTALSGLLALVTVYLLYAPDDYRSFLSEVVIELKKVTWPGWNETRRSTLIVIVFTIVLSGFLWVSDTTWSFVTDWILTPG